MKQCKWLRSFIVPVLTCLPVFCFAKEVSDKGGSVTIVVDPVYDGKPLVLTDQFYVNGHGDTLFIDVFKCYITNLTLTGAAQAKDSNSHLVDAEHTGACSFQVDQVVPGSYTSVHFTAGVDSVANTSGANGGDLDPSKGMYWAWNTGYVMAKLEGRSNACKTLHHAFEFHIGGYMPPYNAARTVALQLPRAIDITAGKRIVIHIKADAAAWFRGVSLTQTNSIVIPGKEACSMADNYATMFSIGDITSE